MRFGTLVTGCRTRIKFSDSIYRVLMQHGACSHGTISCSHVMRPTSLRRQSRMLVSSTIGTWVAEKRPSPSLLAQRMPPTPSRRLPRTRSLLPRRPRPKRHDGADSLCSNPAGGRYPSVLSAGEGTILEIQYTHIVDTTIASTIVRLTSGQPNIEQHENT
jgi:hypothetical protein